MDEAFSVRSRRLKTCSKLIPKGCFGPDNQLPYGIPLNALVNL